MMGDQQRQPARNFVAPTPFALDAREAASQPRLFRDGVGVVFIGMPGNDVPAGPDGGAGSSVPADALGENQLVAAALAGFDMGAKIERMRSLFNSFQHLPLRRRIAVVRLLDDVDDSRAPAVLERWRKEFGVTIECIRSGDGVCAVVRPAG